VSKRVVVGVFVACGISGACGGSTGRGTITIAGIERATRAAHTVRFAGEATDSSDPGSHAQVTGEADFDKSLWHYVITDPARPGISTEWLVHGKQLFISGKEGAKKVRPCLTNAQPGVVGFRPDTALKSFASQGWKITRVGTDTVRGVETIRYRLTRRADQPADVWIDQQGRLRRVIDRQDTETDTVEFYDYGSDLDSLTIPPPTPCHGFFGR
jgi:hypothetical protein